MMMIMRDAEDEQAATRGGWSWSMTRHNGGGDGIVGHD
jgi:hypothetical protein